VSISRDVILAYHNVVPDGAGGQGDVALHVERSAFAEQLEVLLERAEVVPLEAMAEAPTPARGRPRVAITFDDAYVGAVTLAVEELVSRGLPATIFVTPGLLGRRSFWWDDVGCGGGGHAALMRIRDHALTALAGRDERIREWATAEGIDIGVAPPEYRAASEDELTRAAREPGIALGAHSWSHPALSELDGSDLREELQRPLEWLDATLPFARVLPWLAWPYGAVNDRARRAAEAAGYEMAVALAPGRVSHPLPDRLAVRRTTIPAGISRAGFAVRVSGVWGGS
jgi:peptidoglycan/xylan/chitin deacetylase (PgdA/CDA1 family)